MTVTVSMIELAKFFTTNLIQFFFIGHIGQRQDELVYYHS
jgi:hypothetical protein